MGERLYYGDPFLTRFTATVTDIRLASQDNGQQLWQVALDCSAFYPDSGGQPHDTGALLARSAGGAVLTAPVLAVEEDAQGEVWHTTSKPLLAGTTVEGEVDWPRRLDHMQQHSGQHLLSACFLRACDAPTVSFHLGAETSTIDIAMPASKQALDEMDIARVLATANEIVAEDRPMRIHEVTQEEAQAMVADGQLRKLPERGGNIRVIEMEGVEWNACGGTHVARTGQIGAVQIRGVEKVKAGLYRVTFVCGGRAVTAARQDFLLLQEVGRILSAPAAGLPEVARSLQEQSKAAAKEKQRLLEEMAGVEAELLRARAIEDGGLRWLEAVVEERGGGYVRLVASRIVQGESRMIVLLSSGKDPVSIALAATPDTGRHCGEMTQSALAARGLRGGGGATLAQSSVPAAEWPGLKEYLRNAIRGG